MNNEDNNLDLLDLDDADTMDTLQDAVPFAAPRPKKPWLLFFKISNLYFSSDSDRKTTIFSLYLNYDY